jgi:O-antigen ligase
MSPVWAFSAGGRPGWRGLAAIGLTLLFILMILATGSRAGIGLGLLGVSLGLFIVRRSIRQWLSRYPGWVIWSSVASLIAVVAILVGISIIENRAVSVNRVFAIDPGQDMRSRGLPTIMAMIRTYFPFGSGLGGFDPIFRMNEPFGLLKPTYFNHAHNDVLEIALDAGLPGLLLLVTALGWWAWLSVRAWRADVSVRHALPKLGSAMLLLVVVASLFDYPARTPVVMALVIIAALWLNDASDSQDRSALPKGGQHL